MNASADRCAVWALTPGGARLACTIADAMPASRLFLPAASDVQAPGARRFARLKTEVAREFTRFAGHIFIMATGIVVRCIAPHLVHKIDDPAVVVCDEAGRFAISLVSGHVGGANALARQVADIVGGRAVITTATDVNGLPAIDLIAADNHLRIENPDAIKGVNMALLDGGPIHVHDPYGRVIGRLPPDQVRPTAAGAFDPITTGIFVDHIRLDLPPHVLVLRPGSLVAGMGCNRGTTAGEMHALLTAALEENHLSKSSLRALATADLKADEPGLLALAESLSLPLAVFSRDRLKAEERVPTPSAMVEKHIGVQSVCEAAALLATHRGRLIVPKRKSANATVAVAADGYISSASAPAAPST